MGAFSHIRQQKIPCVASLNSSLATFHVGTVIATLPAHVCD